MSFLKLCLFVLCMSFLVACSSSEKVEPGWFLTGQMQTPRAGAAGVIHQGWIYMTGGIDGQNYLRSVERAPILSDGALGEWEYVRVLPEARGFHAATVYQGFLYLAGGANGASGNNLLNSVIRAQIQADGGLGVWQSAGANMLLPRRCNKLLVQGNSFIVLGGYGGTLLDSVERGVIGIDGQVTAWEMLPNKLIKPRYINAVSYSNNNIYVLGGHQASGGGGLLEVEKGEWQAADYQWRPVPAMKFGRYGLGSVLDDERLFALGGMSGAQFFDQVEQWQSGWETWRETTRLPHKMANFVSLSHEGRVYLLGGATASGYLADVSVARITSDGKFVWSGRQAEKRVSQASSVQTSLTNRGLVLESLSSRDYVYMRLQLANGKQEWIAGPPLMVNKGQSVAFSDGITMKNFSSQSLARQFTEIRLVSRLEVLD